MLSSTTAADIGPREEVAEGPLDCDFTSTFSQGPKTDGRAGTAVGSEEFIVKRGTVAKRQIIPMQQCAATQNR